MSKKVRFIEQSEHSECGITSVTMLLNYFGIKVSLNSLRDKYGVPKGGNTLFHLKKIIQDYGIETSGYKVEKLDFFKENNRPCILFWDNRHYVVFEKITFNKVIIVDPAQGRKKYSHKEFLEHFSYTVLIPTDINKKVANSIKEEMTMLQGAGDVDVEVTPTITTSSTPCIGAVSAVTGGILSWAKC